MTPDHADDITTIRGEKFTNVSISRVEPDGIVVIKSDGIVKIPFGDLSPELRAKYGYNPEKAAQFNAAFKQRIVNEQQKPERQKLQCSCCDSGSSRQGAAGRLGQDEEVSDSGLSVSENRRRIGP